jgi:hypothetical protein
MPEFFYVIPEQRTDMATIPERLRNFGPAWAADLNGGKIIPFQICGEAANEIERLQREIEVLGDACSRRNERIDRLTTENQTLKAQLLMHRCLSDNESGTVKDCITEKRCGCCNGLLIASVFEQILGQK